MPLTPQEKQKTIELLKKRPSGREQNAAARVVPEWYKAYMGRVNQREEIVESSTSGVPARVIISEAKERDDPCKLFINFHGGGFIHEQDEDDDMFCARVAAEIRGIVVDVDYAIMPEYIWPTAFEQSYDIVGWVFEHLNDWNVDPAHVSIGGHSAGGTLTGSICLKAAATGDFKFALQVLDYGAIDNWTPTTMVSDPVMNAPTILFIDGEMENLKDPYCSCVFATDDQLANIAPTLIVTAQQCPFREAGEEYGKRLAQAGNEVTMMRCTKSRHGFTIRLGDEWEKAQEFIINGLKNH